MNEKLKVPHITISLAKGARAIDTKNLCFKKLKKPIKIKGRFGFWIKKDDFEFLSFEEIN